MNWRAWIIGIVIMLVLANIIFMQASKISQLKTEREQVIDFANTEKKETAFYKNKWERETAKAQVLDLSLNNAKDLISNERLSFVRQFNGINKRLNNLEQVSQTTAQVVASWELPLRDTFLVNLDSTVKAARVFEYKDSLNRISGLIIGNQIKPQIEITVPLQGAMYWQRNKILGLRIGRKKYFSDITSTNPIVKIQSHETIRVKKR